MLLLLLLKIVVPVAGSFSMGGAWWIVARHSRAYQSPLVEVQ
jgi:hypothetical protein